MATFVMLTRIARGAVAHPGKYEELGKEVIQKLKEECPEVSWLANYAVLGPYDYVDVFEAPSNEVATRVALIVRSFGHAFTEILPATPWERFREIVREAEGKKKAA